MQLAESSVGALSFRTNEDFLVALSDDFELSFFKEAYFSYSQNKINFLPSFRTSFFLFYVAFGFIMVSLKFLSFFFGPERR